MPVSEKLLEILQCPRTKQNLRQLEADKVAKINLEIERGNVKYYDGSPVDDVLDEALITEDRKVIYRVDQGIPVLMIDQGIPTE
jgi:uncharacterized protein YbaR (Trm112 family)